VRPSPDVELSVVIPAFQAEATIGAQLDALLAQSSELSWEIVVVDNGSTDGTADEVALRAERNGSKVRCVSATARRGPGYARNVGAAAARGRALAFCDADDLVGPSWVSAMANALSECPVVTGPLDLEMLNPEHVRDSRGGAFADGLCLFAEVVPFAPSANLGVRTADFVAVGGFDEALMAGEDIELCYRLWRHGLPLVAAPDAVVSYRQRTTAWQLFRQSAFYTQWVIRLYWRIADDRVRRPGLAVGLRRWLWLVRKLPNLRDPAGRARWAWVAGDRVGAIIGSVRYRILHP
jgi:glycosyltransferase involved in cell wall biosynthesis